MGLAEKHVSSLEVRLRNARGPDEKAAGARDKGNTPVDDAAPVLKASRLVVTDNYATLRTISLGGYTNMVTGKEKAHG